MKPATVSRTRALLALVNYLLGYQYLYPRILVSIYKTMNLHFNPIWLEAVIYIFTFAVTLYLLWPAYVSGFKKFFQEIDESVHMVIIFFMLLLAVTVASSLVVTFVFHKNMPGNQEVVIERLNENPLFYGFIAVAFGPVVEEGVFRECIVRQFKREGHPLTGKIISALLFGAVHLTDLITKGSLSELPFLLIYGSMGFVLAECYDRSDSLFCPVLVHSVNNLLGVLL